MALNLPSLWFALIAVLWIGYFFLEGFDFGVGILLPFIGRDDGERRQILGSIAPVWDGNEVWLIVAGGATFAAFPEWYATMFSAFYPVLFLILAALIFRGVAIEYRNKGTTERARRWWDWAVFGGSLVPALAWGAAFGNLLHGIPINANKEFTGSLLDLIGPYPLLGGLATLALFALHGGLFLSLKTGDELAERARRFVQLAWPAASLVVFGFLAWSYVNALAVHFKGVVPDPVPLTALGALLVVTWLQAERMHLLAFFANGLAIALFFATIFLNLYPRVMVSTGGPALDLTIQNASSTPYTLGVMTVVAVIFTPIVLIYQGWTYWVFRKRITAGAGH
jgi:cytochrome bd ubiquinol oxidase subunit II